MLIIHLLFKNLSGPTSRLKRGQYTLCPQGLSCQGTILDESPPWALPKCRGPPPHRATLSLEMLPDSHTSASSLTAAHTAAFAPALVGGGSHTAWAPLVAWPPAQRRHGCSRPPRHPAPGPGVKEPAHACVGRTHTTNTETRPDPLKVPRA